MSKYTGMENGGAMLHRGHFGIWHRLVDNEIALEFG
jgi:hypothetical protein